MVYLYKNLYFWQKTHFFTMTELKYTYNLPQFDIRRFFDSTLYDKKASVLCTEAGINQQMLSRFRKCEGGIKPHDVLKFLIVSNCQVINHRGKVILGNPDHRSREIEDNSIDVKLFRNKDHAETISSEDGLILKYTQKLPKFNFRRHVDSRLLEINASYMCKICDVNHQILSNYRRLTGGMDWQMFIRMIIGLEWKIVDERGNILLGNYQNRDQELADNNTQFIEI